MAGSVGEVRVRGLAELNRALARVNKDAAKEVRDALKKAGEPAREQAEANAFGNIGNIGPRWGRMRLGVRTGSVYIAPTTRRSGGAPRPNLGALLLNEAMLPAVEDKLPEVVREVEKALDHLFDRNGF